ncbi:TPA: rRNA pseudouridine synthase [Candidatus Woesearchaeota archaeon]|nr:rRNA pseudouridine synthase [Candidatus Woesearchaeota archaeon]
MLQRVQKIIANAGITSRRRAEELIAEGKVKVNGKVIGLGDKADPDRDNIIVDGKKLELGKKLYVMFHKPVDCLTTLDDPKGRKTIFSYLPFKTRLIPCGRLDYKTEGLLLLTNDGDWANKVMHPRYEVEKTYLVTLDKEFRHEDLEKVKKGVWIDEFGAETRPAKVRYASEDKKTIEITIHEGKNRIVRRMMKAMEYNVARLMRTRVGNLDLGELRRGTHRKLSNKEIMMFK